MADAHKQRVTRTVLLPVFPEEHAVDSNRKMPDYERVSKELIRNGVTLKLLKKFRPDLFGINRFNSSKANDLKAIRQYAQYGDSQPAVVASTNPFLVAVYSDEFDAVIMVNFTEEILKTNNLHLGDRLLSVNVYQNDMSNFHSDIIPGFGYLNNWSGFIPTVVDFVSKDLESIKTRKSIISEELWERTGVLAKEYLIEKPNVFRTGIPARPSN